MQKLRVLPKGSVLVPRHESIMAGGPKQFIGRAYSAPAEGESHGGAWPVAEGVSPDAPIEVPSMHDLEIWNQYAREVRDGALWAADEATAAACGVKFDPKFGGEFAASEKA